jgi:voltage-gated potassium channel
VQKQISELKDHFIVCGFGRIGRIISNELAADDIDFVVIEQDSAIIEKIESKNYLFLEMDATSEEALLKAGIMEANGIVTALASDADNVFITLTAKGLQPDIYILARASHENNEDKLSRAGASRVVSLGLMMEEATVGNGSGLPGKNLVDSNLRKDFGVIIVAIKKMDGKMIFNPMPSETLEVGDVIVVIGKKEDLKRMNAVM